MLFFVVLARTYIFCGRYHWRFAHLHYRRVSDSWLLDVGNKRPWRLVVGQWEECGRRVHRSHDTFVPPKHSSLLGDGAGLILYWYIKRVRKFQKVSWSWICTHNFFQYHLESICNVRINPLAMAPIKNRIQEVLLLDDAIEGVSGNLFGAYLKPCVVEANRHVKNWDTPSLFSWHYSWRSCFPSNSDPEHWSIALLLDQRHDANHGRNNHGT